MLFSKTYYQCSHCKREIGELDNIAIIAQVAELNGVTHLGRFAKARTILCAQCFEGDKKHSSTS